MWASYENNNQHNPHQQHQATKWKTLEGNFTICLHESDADGIFGRGFFERLNKESRIIKKRFHPTHDERRKISIQKKEKERKRVNLNFPSISYSSYF